ncbi:MAG: transporter substrate-binding domain-containing protein [Oscillospiraceae bacterium]|nr:transporter substrate-binding domain-containing protein [Oscillospiraceae bacterium]
MKTLKRTAGFSALALSALLLTGCGSSIPKNTVHSIADLNGKKIGVQIGTTGDTLAGDIENATVQQFTKAADGVQALQQGLIDAVMVDEETANTYVAENEDIEVLSEAYADEQYAIAVAKENTALLEEINGALSQLSLNGTLGRIKDNYEGDEQGQHPYEVQKGVNRPKGKLIMATNAEFPPYEEWEGEEIVGFDVDMMNAVCDYLGYELQISDMSFESVLPAVSGGRADVGVAGLSVTEERLQEVAFSDVYATTRQVVIVRKD